MIPFVSPAVPVNVNELPFVSSLLGLVNNTGTGFVLSTVTSTLCSDVFPTVSVAVTVNLCTPSLSEAAVYSLLQLPSAPNVLIVTSAAPASPLVTGVSTSWITRPVTPFTSVTFPLIVTFPLVALVPVSVPRLRSVIDGAFWSAQNVLFAVAS